MTHPSFMGPLPRPSRGPAPRLPKPHFSILPEEQSGARLTRTQGALPLSATLSRSRLLREPGFLRCEGDPGLPRRGHVPGGSLPGVCRLPRPADTPTLIPITLPGPQSAPHLLPRPGRSQREPCELTRPRSSTWLALHPTPMLSRRTDPSLGLPQLPSMCLPTASPRLLL